jgi:signal transduction histidine kinase
VQLTTDSSTALFRMTQEMLTNVIRHAHASTVQLRLFESAGSLVLECTDNGDGIAVYRTRRPGSLGLRGMEERAALLGGSFTIAGMPDIGTTATVSLPLTSVRVPAMENQP